jgi:hypothetical protein
MNKKLPIFAFIIFTFGLLTFYVVSRGAVPQAGNSAQDLNNRVKALEKQVADLQKQMNELALKSRVLTIPDAGIFSGNQMPRGAMPHEIGGIKYWTIPLKDSK